MNKILIVYIIMLVYIPIFVLFLWGFNQLGEPYSLVFLVLHFFPGSFILAGVLDEVE